MARGVAAVAAGACRAGGFELRYLEGGGSGFVERQGRWRRAGTPGSRTCRRCGASRPIRGSGTSRACTSPPAWAGMSGSSRGLSATADAARLLAAGAGVLRAAVLAAVADRAAGSRRHAPDFFARLADGGGVVIDVRPDDRIEPEDAEVFAATQRRARRWAGATAGSGCRTRCWRRTCAGWRATGIPAACARSTAPGCWRRSPPGGRCWPGAGGRRPDRGAAVAVSPDVERGPWPRTWRRRRWTAAPWSARRGGGR